MGQKLNKIGTRKLFNTVLHGQMFFVFNKKKLSVNLTNYRLIIHTKLPPIIKQNYKKLNKNKMIQSILIVDMSIRNTYCIVLQ